MYPLIVSSEYVNHRVSMDLNMLYSEIAHRRRCSVLAQMLNLMFYCSIAQANHNFSIIFNREFAIANKVVLPIHGKHKLRLLDEFTSERQCFCRPILDSLDAPVQIKGQCREVHCMAHLSTSVCNLSFVEWTTMTLVSFLFESKWHQSSARHQPQSLEIWKMRPLIPETCSIKHSLKAHDMVRPRASQDV